MVTNVFIHVSNVRKKLKKEYVSKKYCLVDKNCRLKIAMDRAFDKTYGWRWNKY